MKLLYRILFGMHVFVGIGAIGGGLVGIFNPQNPLGMPMEPLKNSPFNSYLIPGIILFTVIGLGNVTSVLALLFKYRYRGYVSSVFSWALVIWIIVQCTMLNTVHPLHIIFFITGLVEAALSTIILFKQSLFPANLILNYYKKIREKHGNSADI